jgi:hypothetical protein
MSRKLNSRVLVPFANDPVLKGSRGTTGAGTVADREGAYLVGNHGPGQFGAGRQVVPLRATDPPRETATAAWPWPAAAHIKVHSAAAAQQQRRRIVDRVAAIMVFLSFGLHLVAYASAGRGQRACRVVMARVPRPLRPGRDGDGRSQRPSGTGSAVVVGSVPRGVEPPCGSAHARSRPRRLLCDLLPCSRNGDVVHCRERALPRRYPRRYEVCYICTGEQKKRRGILIPRRFFVRPCATLRAVA